MVTVHLRYRIISGTASETRRTFKPTSKYKIVHVNQSTPRLWVSRQFEKPATPGLKAASSHALLHHLMEGHEVYHCVRRPATTKRDGYGPHTGMPTTTVC